MERILVDKEEVKDPNCYNIRVGGEGGSYNRKLFGKKHSDETKLKLSLASSGKNDHKNKGIWFTPKGSFYSSIKAAKSNNISKSVLISRCKGVRKQYSKHGVYLQKVNKLGFWFLNRVYGS